MDLLALSILFLLTLACEYIEYLARSHKAKIDNERKPKCLACLLQSENPKDTTKWFLN